MCLQRIETIAIPTLELCASPETRSPSILDNLLSSSGKIGPPSRAIAAPALGIFTYKMDQAKLVLALGIATDPSLLQVPCQLKRKTHSIVPASPLASVLSILKSRPYKGCRQLWTSL